MGYDPFIGEITIFAGNYVPEGYLPCDGRLLQVSQYQALFSILGNRFGGDGRTNFALPDLRGRVAVGVGQAPNMNRYDLGSKGGTETVTLTSGNLPAHSHTAQITETNISTTVTMRASSANGTETSPEGAVPAVINKPAVGPATLQLGYTKNDPNVDMKPTAVNVKLQNVAVQVSPAGGSQAMDNRQPYLAMNYIIAVEGVYPIRS